MVSSGLQPFGAFFNRERPCVAITHRPVPSFGHQSPSITRPGLFQQTRPVIPGPHPQSRPNRTDPNLKPKTFGSLNRMTSALTLVADVSVDFADVLVTPPTVHLPSLVPLDPFSPVNPLLHHVLWFMFTVLLTVTNYCMPTDFPELLFTVYMLSLWVPTLRPRINPYGPEVTPQVAPTPTGPRDYYDIIIDYCFHCFSCTYWDTLSSVAHTVNSPISDLLDRPHEDRHWRIDALV
ncbi:hypothetical protein V6N13_024068 [Hibiscus sabdariffa]